MAIAVDVADLGGTAALANSVSSRSFNTGSAVASGGFIVLGGMWYTDNTTTITSITGGSLTWTVDKLDSSGGSPSIQTWLASAQAPSGLASGTTITVNVSASSVALNISGTSFTGVKTSSPVDGTPVTTKATATTTWTTGNYTIQDGSLLVAVTASAAGAGTPSSTATAPSIEAWDKTNAVDGLGYTLAYRIESTGATYTVAGTLAVSSDRSTVGVAYLSGGPAVGNIAWITA